MASAEQPTPRWAGFDAYLLDQVQAAVIATDLAGTVIRWNSHAEALFGWPASEALGRTFADLFAGRMGPVDAGAIQESVAAGKRWEGNFPVRRLDGSIVECHAALTPLRDPDGAVGGVVIVSVDITERRRAERLLAARTGVTRALADAGTLVEATPRVLQAVCESLGWQLGMLWTVDHQSDVIRCLDVWQTPGLSLAEFVTLSRSTPFPRGIGLPGRVWESGQPAWIPDVTEDTNFPRAEAAGREDIHGAFGFPISLGSQVLGVIEFFSRKIQEPDTDLLVAMGVIGSQIGQFMERREAESAVRESEARKTAILETALDGLVMMDHEGNIVEFNPAAEVTFGRQREDVLGKPMADLIIPPAYRERHWEGLARYLATGEGPVIGKRVEFSGMRPDGTEFPIELAISRVDLPGLPLFTGFVRDITERVRAQQAQRFLAESGALLTASIQNYEDTLRRVAQLAVAPMGTSPVADWCAVSLKLDDGTIKNVAVEHADPAKVQLAREWGERYPSDPSAPTGPPEVIRTGRSEIYPDITDEMIKAAARDPEHLEVMRGLGMRSALVVPMVGTANPIGAITFVSAESARRYGPADLAFAEELGRRTGMAVENARLFQERRTAAQKFQESLLPPELPQISGIELHGSYRWGGQGNEVGGDFYDAFGTGDGSWALVIGDVCGKGPEAAVVTGLARHTIRAVAAQERKPSQILSRLNDAVLEQRSDRMFCTVCYVRMKPNSQGSRLTICCAGHPLPLILRADGTVETAGEPGTLLGIFADPELADHPADLRRGDAMVLYTDGVIEEHAQGAVFGRERLVSLLASCAGQDAEGIGSTIVRAVLGFKPDAPRDDLAILVLRITP